jgi:hypothetical protein
MRDKFDGNNNNNMNEQLIDTPKLDAPQEFSDDVIERAKESEAGGFTIAIKRPTYKVRIPAPGGKTREIDVPDKTRFWALPGKFLLTMAHNVSRSPSTGIVSITNEQGQHVARFPNRERAAKHLKAAGIDPNDLHGALRVWGEIDPKTGRAIGEPEHPRRERRIIQPVSDEVVVVDVEGEPNQLPNPAVEPKAQRAPKPKARRGKAASAPETTIA